MDVRDLWVGENVRIVSSNRFGTFVAERNGKAEIKLDTGKTLLVEGSDLVVIQEDQKRSQALIDLEKELQSEKVAKAAPGVEEYAAFPREFDLHLPALNYNPTKTDKEPLEFQIHKCKEYLSKALELKIARVIIIHGKGEGILRSEVLDLISVFEPIMRIDPDFREGCCVFWMEYD